MEGLNSGFSVSKQMVVYRLTKEQYSRDLSGFGAAQYPGRWNKKGVPVLYTCQNQEIALLELVVNLPPMLHPSIYLMKLEVPDRSVLEIKAQHLPPNWREYPAPSYLSDLGQQWVEERKYLGLKVPSAVIVSSFNLLLNPSHPLFTSVKLIESEPFRLDHRLINKIK